MQNFAYMQKRIAYASRKLSRAKFFLHQEQIVDFMKHVAYQV